jgi:hypothetical protein
MLADLPKLVGKDFAIGCLLPVAVFLVLTLSTAQSFDIWIALAQDIKAELAVGATLIVLVAWLMAISLLALNRLIYRALEGYGLLNPLRLLGGLERQRYKQLKNEILTLEKSVAATADSNDANTRARLGRRVQTIVERYPDSEEWLLPTSFGNTIRAFEVYPRVMYGIEGIQGWLRLLGVIPKDYMETLTTAKSQADLWVNFLVLTLIYVFFCLWLIVLTASWQFLWIPVVAIAVCLLFYSLARSGVQQWGELVKAAFDIFLPDLHKKFEFEASLDPAARRTKWSKWSQAVIYRNPKFL